MRTAQDKWVVGIGEILWDILPDGKQLGGAPANFAYHARSLGARAGLVSGIGDDNQGAEILQRLDSWGVDRRHVSVRPEYPTGTVSVTLDERGVPHYTIQENVAWDHIPWSPALEELAARADAVCFGSLCQRSLESRETIRRFLAATPVGCLRVCDINLRQSYYDAHVIAGLLERASVLKLNDEELPVLSSMFGLSGPTESVMRGLADRFGLDLVALTRGGRGSLLVTAQASSNHPGFPVEVVDTVGAGDAFTAALVVGLLRGDDLDTVNESASRLAADVCSQAGGTPDVHAMAA